MLRVVFALLLLSGCSHMIPDQDPNVKHVPGWVHSGEIRYYKKDPWTVHYTCYAKTNWVNKILFIPNSILPIPHVTTIPGCAMLYTDGSCSIWYAHDYILEHEERNCRNIGYEKVVLRER